MSSGGHPVTQPDLPTHNHPNQLNTRLHHPSHRRHTHRPHSHTRTLCGPPTNTYPQQSPAPARTTPTPLNTLTHNKHKNPHDDLPQNSTGVAIPLRSVVPQPSHHRPPQASPPQRQSPTHPANGSPLAGWKVRCSCRHAVKTAHDTRPWNGREDGVLSQVGRCAVCSVRHETV